MSFRLFLVLFNLHEDRDSSLTLHRGERRAVRCLLHSFPLCRALRGPACPPRVAAASEEEQPLGLVLLTGVFAAESWRKNHHQSPAGQWRVGRVPCVCRGRGTSVLCHTSASRGLLPHRPQPRSSRGRPDSPPRRHEHEHGHEHEHVAWARASDTPCFPLRHKENGVPSLAAAAHAPARPGFPWAPWVKAGVSAGLRRARARHCRRGRSGCFRSSSRKFLAQVRPYLEGRAPQQAWAVPRCLRETPPDFKYWEDGSDEYHPLQGSLLPLWKFRPDLCRGLAVSDLCCSPVFPDLFAAAYTDPSASISSPKYFGFT
ncbi:Dynein intermediate chain 1, axonemal [Chionoecetes opilio]|uniref:Dynein intermediate chain 1, axonemal n=1 Tax=Chionoecetes opilio TaxID=41210 RepID=A0A8J5CRY3_CHIOP|nr:Dynein intermediate chain 1, axonemal [Chionoecetes opilio]